MVEILSSGYVSDGYDVAVSLNDGRPHTFHFLTAPENIQDIVDTLALSLEQSVEILPSVVTESPIEATFKAQRDQAKTTAIMYIYSHPDCTVEDVIASTADVAPMLNGEYLLNIYIVGAYTSGFISENTFEAFKIFILSRSIEQLMAI